MNIQAILKDMRNDSRLRKFLSPETITQALDHIEAIFQAYFEAREIPAVTMRDVRRELQRTLNAFDAGKVAKGLKILRGHLNKTDADTAGLLEPLLKEVIGQEPLPPRDDKLMNELASAVSDRIAILAAWGKPADANARLKQIDSKQNVRKIRNERDRFPCALLGLVHRRFGANITDHYERRNFVIAVATYGGISFPDPKNPNNVDAWIDSPVDSTDTETFRLAHHLAASTARDLGV